MRHVIHFILMTSVLTQEVPTPATLLGPKHFNHHAFDAEQYLKSLNLPVPTMKGPVLFPNDAPPPPRPPLVVTSRPLIESIARSNLNGNNSIAQPSSHGVSFVPYLGRGYKPYLGYATERYYQTQTALPPVYKTIARNSKTITTPDQRGVHYDYQIKEPEYSQQSNEVQDGNSADYGNYAFSYAVKDKKTGDDFSHSQQSTGSATNGEYRVRLPDGRIQIVSYTADENGYKADVRYDDTSAKGGDINVYNVQYDDKQYVDDKVTNHLTDKDYNNVNHYNKVEYVDNKNHAANKNDYINAQPRDFKTEYNNYDTKEYYNDYSSEYNDNYLPHTNKFANIVNKQSVQVSTVMPPYEQIKELFTPNKFYNNQNVVTTTNYPYVATTENVVLIGAKPNLYTNILSTLSPVVATTPRNYLVSTIANLKNKLNFNQPVLSKRFIDKINKYLKFN